MHAQQPQGTLERIICLGVNNMADILPESPGLFFVCKAYRILYSVVWHYVALIGGKRCN